MSAKSPWGTGSLSWFVLSLIVPPALTVAGLISSWLLFEAGAQREKERIAFEEELKKPILECQLALSANPAAENAPEEIMETITVRNVGPNTATNVLLHVKLNVDNPGKATLPGRPKEGIELYQKDDEVGFNLPSLRRHEFVDVEIPLKRSEIRNLGTGRDFLRYQEKEILVTSDGGPDLPRMAEPKVPAIGYHRVRSFETLVSIGKLYDVNPYDIAQINGLKDPNQIYEGQVLLIP